MKPAGDAQASMREERQMFNRPCDARWAVSCPHGGADRPGGVQAGP